MTSFKLLALAVALLAAVAHADYQQTVFYSDSSCTNAMSTSMSTQSCTPGSGGSCTSSTGGSYKSTCVASTATSLPISSLPNGLVSVYYSDSKCTVAVSATVNNGCQAMSPGSLTIGCSATQSWYTAFSTSTTYVINRALPRRKRTA